jgi:L-fuconolactonase
MIDSHFHVWDAGARDHSWLSAAPTLELRYPIERYESEATRLAIDGAVLVQVLNDAAETLEFLDVAGASPLVEGVVGWVDLTAPDVEEQLAALQESPHGRFVVGVRPLLEGVAAVDFLEQPAVFRGLCAVAKCGLTFDFMGRTDQLASARRVLERCNELRIVLDRAGKPLLSDLGAFNWREHLVAMARTGRVAAKFAGLANEAGPGWSADVIQPVVDVLLDTLGPTSLMFGSDWPVCLMVASFDEVVDLTRDCFRGLDASELAGVLGENARRVYGLAPASLVA